MSSLAQRCNAQGNVRVIFLKSWDGFFQVNTKFQLCVCAIIFLINLEEWESWNQEAQKKFCAQDENRTHDSPSSSSDTLSTELLEVLWRAGSEFNYNYNSHRGLHRGLALWYSRKQLSDYWDMVTENTSPFRPQTEPHFSLLQVGDLGVYSNLTGSLSRTMT